MLRESRVSDRQVDNHPLLYPLPSRERRKENKLILKKHFVKNFSPLVEDPDLSGRERIKKRGNLRIGFTSGGLKGIASRYSGTLLNERIPYTCHLPRGDRFVFSFHRSDQGHL
jgi:hypothetical protein